MEIARFDRSKLNFPAECARCGCPRATRSTRLILPYQAWWRSNPAIKVPVCTRCFLSLGTQAWVSLILALGISLVAAFYLPKLGIQFLIHTQRALFHSVSVWVDSRWTAEVAVLGSVVLVFLFLASLRQRFLRGMLSLKVEDYRDDWVELSSDNALYFAKLAKNSQLYQEL